MCVRVCLCVCVCVHVFVCVCVCVRREGGEERGGASTKHYHPTIVHAHAQTHQHTIFFTPHSSGMKLY